MDSLEQASAEDLVDFQLKRDYGLCETYLLQTICYIQFTAYYSILA